VPTCGADRELYEASAESILAVLRRSETPSVMLIGHNPGIGEFAGRIVTAPPKHWRFGDYPTCATTVMTFPREAWSDVGWGEAEVVDFTVPRDLIGD
jgi:phosphohistidine phosphatase